MLKIDIIPCLQDNYSYVIYESSTEIVGVIEVIKEAYLDKTDKSERFVAVTVKFIEKLSKPITLESIKKSKELSHLALIKQSRLSVMPIDSKSWKILNKMSKV